MKISFQYIRQFFRDGSLSTIDKAIQASMVLCSLSIILSIILAQIFAWIIILLSLSRSVTFPKRRKTPFDIPLLVFIIVRVTSIVFSTDFSASLRALHTEIPYYTLFYAITQQQALLSERFIRLILWMFIISAMVGSCYGTLAVLLGWESRAASLTTGYYTLGSYLTATLVMTLVLGKSTMMRRRWIWYIVILIMTLGVLLTLNRIHWGIMAVAFFVTGVLQERKLLSIVIIVFVLVFLVSPTVNYRLSQMVHVLENLSGRDVLWKGAAMIWTDHPILGYGQNTFVEIFPLRDSLEDRKVGGWHNDYLQIYIESGLFGLTALLWLLSSIYYQAFVRFRKFMINGEDAKLVLAILAGMSAILLSSLSGSAFLDILIRMMFMFLLSFYGLLLKQKGGGVFTASGKTDVRQINV